LTIARDEAIHLAPQQHLDGEVRQEDRALAGIGLRRVLAHK